jgi:hypothetical protein
MSEPRLSPSYLAPRLSLEAADMSGLSGQDHAVSARRAEVEEFTDFITRHVLEQDAQFFDG